MSFAFPAVLLLLWLVPALAFLFLALHRRAVRRAAAFSPSAGLAGPSAASRDPGAFHLQLALWCSGAALAVVALARPRWGEEEQTVFSRGRNVVLAVDVSRSMLAQDVHPSRLERSRVDLRDLLDGLEGDRAAIVAFRGAAVAVCPLTTDAAFLRQSLDSLAPDSAPRGETDLAAPIEAALKILEPFSADHNAVILVSDGEDLSGKALEAARRAASASTPVFTVGVGDPKGAAIPLGDGTAMRYRDEEVTTRLDASTLSEIASVSGGTYIPLRLAGTGRTTLGTLYKEHLRRIAAQDFEERAARRPVERYQLFLIPSLLCFLAVAALSTGRPLRRRARRAAAAVLAVLGLSVLGLPAAAESPAGGTNAVPAAAEGPASPSAPATPREIYNEGLATLRSGEPAAAAAVFESLLAGEASSVPAPAREALGVSLARQSQLSTNTAERLELLQRSAAAFQDDAALRPRAAASRRNLAWTAEQLPELRRASHLEKVQAKYGSADPGSLLGSLLSDTRAAFAAAAAATTNTTPDQIGLLEAAAEKVRGTSDIWIPLEPLLVQGLSQAVTNQQELARVLDTVQNARTNLLDAADALADFDPSALDTLRKSASEALGFFTMSAPPPALLDEAVVAESNAVLNVLSPTVPFPPAQDFRAASLLASLFQQRFPAWADSLNAQPQGAPQAPGAAMANGPTLAAEQALNATNAPALSAENRAEIERLAKETVDLFAEVSATLDPASPTLPDTTLADRRTILENLLKIRDLLPKQQNQDQQQNQQQQQQQQQQNQNHQQDQQNQDQQNQDSEQNQNNQDQQDAQDPQKKDENGQQDQQNQDSEQNQDSQDPREQPPEDEKDAQAAEEKDPPEDKPESEAKALLQRMLDEEKERDEERRRHRQTLPPRLHERDW